MKKRILSCLLSIAMCLTLLPLGIQAQAAYFGDVTSHWARSYIEDAVDMGLFNGTAPNRFEPESAMTRAMFVTVLYRMDGGEAERSANFIDVPRGSWYSDAVAWASENSIVTGTSAIRFSPSDSVTREQMVTILNRYLTASGAALGSDGEAPAISFRDSSSIAPYAREAVEKMQRASIVSGKPSGFGYRFDPQGCATRAEVACIMCKFLDQLSYDDIDNEEPDPEAAYEQMDKITQSSTLKSLSSQYENASDSQKKNLAEQAISYFEQQEENGTIDYCDVDRDNGVISYEIDGCKFAFFLYDVEKQGLAPTTGSAFTISSTSSSSQSTAGSLTISPNIVSCASNLVGAASSVSYKGNALILDYYSKNSSDDQAGDFHLITENVEDCFRKVGHTPKTIYGYKVSDLKHGLNNYDFIDFNSHGNIVGNEPVICLSEASSPQTYLIDYADDVKAGTIGCYGNLAGTFGGNRYYVYGSFFPAHYSGNNKLRARWVHLGSCYGFAGSNQLAAGLSEAGAESVTGYADWVSTLFDAFYEVALFERMTSGYTLSKALDPAYNDAKDEVMENISLEDAKKWNMPRLKLYGKGNLEFRVTDDNTGRIKVSLSPDSGTISEGTYTLDRIRSDNSEQGVFSGKEFSGSSFEITGLQSGMTYRLTVKVKNYASAKAEIVASDSPDTTTISLTYDPIGPLKPPVSYVETEVTVEDLDGKTLPNASVTLYGQKDGENFTELTSGTTDSSGHFTVSKLELSYQTLKAEASKTGYISGSTEQSFAGQGKNKRYIEVTLDTEKSLEPDDTSTDLPAADSDGWTRVYNGEQLTKALEANRNIKLMADVKDVEGVRQYKGTLDGNGHTITNPQVCPYTHSFHSRGWISALLGGTIKNLKIADVDIRLSQDDYYYVTTENGFSLGLIGYANGSATIENCTILSGQFSVNADSPKVGAFVGFAAFGDGTIRDCVNMANVSAIGNSSASAYAGGIIGSAYSDVATVIHISHCLNLGSIYAETNGSGSATASGICTSYNYFSYRITITDCGNGGEIFAKNTKTSPYAVETSISPQFSNIPGYTTKMYYWDERYNSSNIQTVSRDTLLSMWSDVLN